MGRRAVIGIICITLLLIVSGVIERIDWFNEPRDIVFTVTNTYIIPSEDGAAYFLNTESGKTFQIPHTLMGLIPAAQYRGKYHKTTLGLDWLDEASLISKPKQGNNTTINIENMNDSSKIIINN